MLRKRTKNWTNIFNTYIMKKLDRPYPECWTTRHPSNSKPVKLGTSWSNCFFSRCRIWQVPSCLVPQKNNILDEIITTGAFVFCFFLTFHIFFLILKDVKKMFKTKCLKVVLGVSPQFFSIWTQVLKHDKYVKLNNFPKKTSNKIIFLPLFC